MIDLSTRRPEVAAQELTHLPPSERFADVSFGSYQPNPEFPSQAQAVTLLQEFLRPQPPPSPAGGRFSAFSVLRGAAFTLTAALESAKPTCWPAPTTLPAAPAP
ncbi:hypothetical protein ACFP81_07245 [Deinococcus lacus]|uniref:Uncharacterized protein n=1 Tax=Deinococcus lacus TaxID=392561 RepID=A0ABW1YC13_9DEIO